MHPSYRLTGMSSEVCFDVTAYVAKRNEATRKVGNSFRVEASGNRKNYQKPGGSEYSEILLDFPNQHSNSGIHKSLLEKVILSSGKPE